MERGGVVGRGVRGGGGEVAVGLVHDDQIGELHDPTLEPLQLVAAARRDQHEEEVDHRRDLHLRLADADGLDQDDVEAGRFAEQERLARPARHAAEGAAGGGRPDEGEGRARELLHARLVAEDRAPTARARRIDGQHRDPVRLFHQVAAERLDERRLARAGRAGDPHPHRVADVREDLGEQRLGLGAVVGARRFHQRDRTRQRAPITLDHLVGQLTHPVRSRCLLDGSLSAGRDTRPAAVRSRAPEWSCDGEGTRGSRQARRSRLTISAAASGMLVPGPKIAATPASRSSS